jgi:hypothetical protein
VPRRAYVEPLRVLARNHASFGVDSEAVFEYRFRGGWFVFFVAVA